MKNLPNKKDESGFTLVEILVVVAILGILLAIAVPSYLKQREAAWDASVQNDVSKAAIAVAQNDNNDGVPTIPDSVHRSEGVILDVDTIVGGDICVSGKHSAAPANTQWHIVISERELMRGSC